MICFCASTRRAARLLTLMYEEALRPANLTPAQFEVLVTLGHRHGISQSELADRLAIDQTTLSRNLKPLVARALVESAFCSKDRRRTTYTLTTQGSESLAAAMPLWRSAHERMRRHLGGQWQATANTLTKLSAAASSIA